MRVRACVLTARTLEKVVISKEEASLTERGSTRSGERAGGRKGWESDRLDARASFSRGVFEEENVILGSSRQL